MILNVANLSFDILWSLLNDCPPWSIFYLAKLVSENFLLRSIMRTAQKPPFFLSAEIIYLENAIAGFPCVHVRRFVMHILRSKYKT